jgi:hypothetical protein
MNHDEHQHLNTKEGKKPGEAKADLKKLQACFDKSGHLQKECLF